MYVYIHVCACIYACMRMCVRVRILEFIMKLKYLFKKENKRF